MTLRFDTDIPGLPEIDPDAFSFEINESSKERWDNLPFLTACRPWLAFHGYTLYDLVKDDGATLAKPSLPPPEPSHVSYPYAFFSYNNDQPVKPCGGYQTCVIYAQDVLRRDVVIKIVEKNSQELLVYQNLLESTKLPIPAPPVMRPIDILVSPHNYAFVVMPRWGDFPDRPGFNNIGEILCYITSQIHGLAFLHSRRIAHRDLSHSNVLINHFDRNDFWKAGASSAHASASCADRVSLRERGLARYCLFDFDISVLFPPHASAADCRLDSSLSDWGISFYHPPDTKQGEFDYDPFPFDVACLGNVLAKYDFVVPSIPLLAPLLDGMTTHIISRRLTAAEAAKFCDYIMDSMSPEELNVPIPPRPVPTGHRAVNDCWKSLPPDFVARWSTYREIPPTLTIRSLRWLADHRLTSGILKLVRRTFRI